MSVTVIIGSQEGLTSLEVDRGHWAQGLIDWDVMIMLIIIIG
jgi:hypothetical protein